MTFRLLCLIDIHTLLAVDQTWKVSLPGRQQVRVRTANPRLQVLAEAVSRFAVRRRVLLGLRGRRGETRQLALRIRALGRTRPGCAVAFDADNWEDAVGRAYIRLQAEGYHARCREVHLAGRTDVHVDASGEAAPPLHGAIAESRERCGRRCGRGGSAEGRRPVIRFFPVAAL